MPVFSLPSKYGIGTLGKPAYDFVDFLVKAGQRYWQILPVGPTSYGDSPYQSFSTFAGNPYFIDLDLLIKDGLIGKADCDACDWGDTADRIDYGKIYENRFKVLKKAFDNGYKRDSKDVRRFKEENADWLPSYALFMALKKHFGMKAWTEWDDDDIRLRRGDSVKQYTLLLADDIDFYTYIQYLFFKQWDELRAYAKENGIGIIGDIPIYIAGDSADVWSDPDSFQLDDENYPTEVAGVPPDYFSADGQLWGNPLYRWDVMKRDGYGWWIRRIGGAQKLYDVLRIDHFRGLESYWAVPYGETTAKHGRWIKGPGIGFVKTITDWFGNMDFIAEDLGILTDDVRDLLKESGLPGMKVLEFAFSAGEPSDYLPHNYDKNCICYGGTHDNNTLRGWLDTADKADVEVAKKYLGLNKTEGYVEGIIRGGMSSTAVLFVTQMQDWLGLDGSARINTPGTPSDNWQWRMTEGALTDKTAKKNQRYDRALRQTAR